MSTNGANTSEDTDMADCDGEKVVTMMDVLQEQQDFEEDANAVLGASDDKNCTYSKGYIKRQAIYACLTCCSDAKEDHNKQAGVCLACSLSCHENHELIELYTKRNFRCDCGNPKFNSNPCQFNPNKNDINEENKYNQNYSGLYCICHRPYPDPESKVEDEMIQCIICEDWLHASHLDAVVPPNDQYSEMICKGCMERNEFLHDYSGFAVTAENTDVDVVSTNDVTISNGHTSDSVLETSKEIAEHNMSVEDVELKDKTADNNIKDKTNNETTPINVTASGSTANIEVEQTQTGSVSYTVINIENETKDKSEMQSPSKIDVTVEENKSNSDSNDVTQGVQEKLKPEEETKTDENPKEMISASTMENENKEKDTDLDNTDNLLDKSESDSKIEEEKLLYEDEASNQTETTDEEEMQTEAKSEEPTDKNLKDEIIKTNTETPTEEQPKDKLIGTTESENSGSFPNTDDQEKSTFTNTAKEDVKDIEPDNSKLPSEADIGASDLDTSKTADDNKDKNDISQTNGIIEENKSITEEIPAKIDNITEENDNTSKDELSKTDTLTEEKDNTSKDEFSKPDTITEENDNTSKDELSKPDTITEENDNTSKDELSKTDTITEENEMQEENQTVNQAEKSDVDIAEQKDNSENENKVPNNTITMANENKRKLSMDEVKDNVAMKKAKVDEAKSCVRPKDGKKHLKGATFWPSSFRQKLCTCNECLAMYKDLSVLFLIDPEDTVSAYEMLGKEKTEGSPSSQYEKGLQALSSLDRIQQINALTEYNKMRDKLLDFLKSFKDRREIVKEEDIKGFFAGMKPKREPDGVYFCR